MSVHFLNTGITRCLEMEKNVTMCRHFLKGVAIHRAHICTLVLSWKRVLPHHRLNGANLKRYSDLR